MKTRVKVFFIARRSVTKVSSHTRSAIFKVGSAQPWNSVNIAEAPKKYWR